jgi:hypothetical protein
VRAAGQNVGQGRRRHLIQFIIPEISKLNEQKYNKNLRNKCFWEGEVGTKLIKYETHFPTDTRPPSCRCDYYFYYYYLFKLQMGF